MIDESQQMSRRMLLEARLKPCVPIACLKPQQQVWAAVEGFHAGTLFPAALQFFHCLVVLMMLISEC